MSQWRCVGQDERLQFEKELTPLNLKEELFNYQEVLGSGFTIQDLLKIYDIRAKAKIAANILDAPEQFVHELSLLETESMGCAAAINNIADALAGKGE